MAVGAALGAYSRVVLDGLTHTDMRPLQPFADGNPLLDLLPFGAEYDLCVVLGLVGAIVAVLRWRPVD